MERGTVGAKGRNGMMAYEPKGDSAAYVICTKGADDDVQTGPDQTSIVR